MGMSKYDPVVVVPVSVYDAKIWFLRMQASACIRSSATHEITQQIRLKLLRMDVLTSEIC